MNETAQEFQVLMQGPLADLKMVVDLLAEHGVESDIVRPDDCKVNS